MKIRLLMAIALILFANLALAQETIQDKETKLVPDKADETKALGEGDKAPDFELESLDDKTVKLSDRFNGEDAKPVVLLFSRAHW